MHKHLHLATLIVLFTFIGLSVVSLADYGNHIHCSACGAEAHMDPYHCANPPESETDRTIWDSVTNIGEAIGSEATTGYSTATAIDEELEAHGVYDAVGSWIVSTGESISDWFWDSADYYYDTYTDAWGY